MHAARIAGPLCASFNAAVEPRGSAAEVAWYLERLPREGGLCLESMCGHGRLLVPLATAGVKVHGVDVSAAMLAECGQRLRSGAASVPLFRQDASELNLPFRYAAAYVAAGAFQSLDVDRARAALARIRAHLVPPGALLLDLYIPAESAQRIAAPLVEVRSATLADGSRIAVRSETTMYPEAQLARTQARYVRRRGRELLAEESEARAIVWYAPDEIAALVREAGYRDVAVGESPREPTDERRFAISARAAP